MQPIVNNWTPILTNLLPFGFSAELPIALRAVSFVPWKIRKCRPSCWDLFATMEGFQAWWSKLQTLAFCVCCLRSLFRNLSQSLHGVYEFQIFPNICYSATYGLWFCANIFHVLLLGHLVLGHPYSTSWDEHTFWHCEGKRSSDLWSIENGSSCEWSQRICSWGVGPLCWAGSEYFATRG